MRIQSRPSETPANHPELSLINSFSHLFLHLTLIQSSGKPGARKDISLS